MADFGHDVELIILIKILLLLLIFRELRQNLNIGTVIDKIMDLLVIQSLVSSFLNLVIFEVELGVDVDFVLVVRIQVIFLNTEIPLMIIGLIHTRIKLYHVFPLNLIDLGLQMVLNYRGVF